MSFCKITAFYFCTVQPSCEFAWLEAKNQLERTLFIKVHAFIHGKIKDRATPCSVQGRVALLGWKYIIKCPFRQLRLQNYLRILLWSKLLHDRLFLEFMICGQECPFVYTRSSPEIRNSGLATMTFITILVQQGRCCPDHTRDEVPA